MYDENAQKKREIEDAKIGLVVRNAMKILATNNNLACMVKIDGLEMGLCNNKKILPIINYEIKEIQKFLAGKPNKWE